MFISKEAAEARLRGDRNLFRGVNSPSVPSEIKHDTPVLPEESQTLEEEEYEVNDAEGEIELSGSLDQPEEAISLPHLDELLHPRVNGRANYKGKLESQVAIGETALILGRAQTARTFQLSPAQTEAYGLGLGDVPRNDPDRQPVNPNHELKRRHNEVKQRLAAKAAARLDLTLEALTPTKLAGIKRATNISKVAKDLAVIMEKCSDVEKTDAQTVHFHVYQPEMNVENNYQTVNVGPTLPSHSEPI